MGARTGQFRRSMRSRFGAGKAEKAERCVQHLKASGGTRSPFAVCSAAMAGTTRHPKRRGG